MEYKKGDLVSCLHHPHKKFDNKYEIIGIEGDMPIDSAMSPSDKIKLQPGMSYLLALWTDKRVNEDVKKPLYSLVQANEQMLTLIKSADNPN